MNTDLPYRQGQNYIFGIEEVADFPINSFTGEMFKVNILHHCLFCDSIMFILENHIVARLKNSGDGDGDDDGNGDLVGAIEASEFMSSLFFERIGNRNNFQNIQFCNHVYFCNVRNSIS